VLALQTAGTTAVTVDASQNVTLAGTLTTTGVTTFQAGTAALPAITTTGDTNTGIFFPAADTIAFSEGGAEAMRIDSSGNLGIGTSSPTGGANRVVDVYGSGSSAINFHNATSGTTATDGGVVGQYGSDLVLYNYEAGIIQFGTSNLERARIDSSGNLGLGISPVSQNGKVFHIDGGAGAADIRLTNNATGSAINNGFIFSLQGSDNYLYNFENAAMVFGTNNTERARIDSSGNLLVGTTTYGGASNVAGFGANPVGQIAVERGGGAAGVFNRFSSDGNLVVFRRQGTTVGSIDVTTTATAYVTSSDYRLKENIAPMTGALAKVAALKPVTYKWKADGSDGEGFIAHELQAICPDAVTGQKDAVDAEGKPVYQGVDTSFLVATLTAAIQEQQALITQLQADVAALKGASA